MNMPVQLNDFQKILVSKVVSSDRSHKRRNLKSLQANCFHKLWANYMSKCMAPQAAIFERDSHCIVGHIQSAVTTDFEKEDGKLTGKIHDIYRIPAMFDNFRDRLQTVQHDLSKG